MAIVNKADAVQNGAGANFCCFRQDIRWSLSLWLDAMESQGGLCGRWYCCWAYDNCICRPNVVWEILLARKTIEPNQIGCGIAFCKTKRFIFFVYFVLSISWCFFLALSLILHSPDMHCPSNIHLYVRYFHIIIHMYYITVFNIQQKKTTEKKIGWDLVVSRHE